MEREGGRKIKFIVVTKKRKRMHPLLVLLATVSLIVFVGLIIRIYGLAFIRIGGILSCVTVEYLYGIEHPMCGNWFLLEKEYVENKIKERRLK